MIGEKSAPRAAVGPRVVFLHKVPDEGRAFSSAAAESWQRIHGLPALPGTSPGARGAPPAQPRKWEFSPRETAPGALRSKPRREGPSLAPWEMRRSPPPAAERGRRGRGLSAPRTAAAPAAPRRGMPRPRTAAPPPGTPRHLPGVLGPETAPWGFNAGLREPSETRHHSAGQDPPFAEWSPAGKRCHLAGKEQAWNGVGAKLFESSSKCICKGERAPDKPKTRGQGWDTMGRQFYKDKIIWDERLLLEDSYVTTLPAEISPTTPTILLRFLISI